MEINETFGQRFDIAMELFAEGNTISYKKVWFILSGADFVVGTMQSSWKPENVSDIRALEDFRIIDYVFSELKESAPKFLEIVQKRKLKKELVDNYGMGSVGVAYMEDNKIFWNIFLQRG